MWIWVNPILKQVILNAHKNARAYPTQRRHTEVITKSTNALFIFSGPFGYEFIQRNMQQGLPTPRSVQLAIHVQYKTLDESVFRFNDLATHIRNHSAPSIVRIAEDATRVVRRVEYDPETDRCVGFVLPIDQDGLPIVDSFLATSFAAINSMFENGSISKYAYVYMAQPLGCNIPPFILACLGTDNKFTAKYVLQRWSYIYTECSKRGISVISFGGDGDSRAMRVSASLLTPAQDPLHGNQPNYSPCAALPGISGFALCRSQYCLCRILYI